ncbi:hypothetical protein QSV08_05050 [Maribacter sp. BPC-D8]|uniref:hypothetical protein n=1 Tax=Maribacter sp. BPC-D8 TaxID=3053613 RepID=UPI002B46037C|nr:hypothetical protein [Maribacter sp. BPC-D8]WRI30609.1 hypothetical protein QSV08_05050 [Maribacter sp. BPC-D8]
MRLYFQVIIVLLATTIQAQNSQDNINYNSFIKDGNIHVQLSTVDQATMLTMLHKGFYVYFDVKGKRKKNVSVQYPINIVPHERPNRNDRNKGNREEQKEEQSGPDIATLLAEMPKIGEYTNLDYEQEFHLDLNQLGVSITYVYNEENKELQYELVIPKHKIADANLSKLSIGIVTPKREKESQDKNSNISFGGGGQGGGSGGGRGGQGRPGGGQGDGGRGGSKGGPPQQEDRPEETTIDIWFKVNQS